METTYYEVRTSVGTVVHQFNDKAALDNWLDAGRHPAFKPNYYIFVITKKEEMLHVHSNDKAATTGRTVQQEPMCEEDQAGDL